MSKLKPININVKEANIKKCTISELYKDLENSNLNVYNAENSGKCDFQASLKVINTGNKTSIEETNKQKEVQLSVFQSSMKIIYLFGLIVGLNPVTGLFKKDVSKIRFSFRSWKFLYSIFISSVHLLCTIICFYRAITKPVSESAIIVTCFYFSTSVSTIFSIYIASKWPDLMLKLLKVELDEYTDFRVKRKCIWISLTFLASALILYILGCIDRYAEVIYCNPEHKDTLKVYCELTYPWLFELNFPYNKFTAFLLLPLNVVTVLIWSYPDLLITCTSLFLSSILKRINEKIISSEGKSFPSVYWISLREDYTRAAEIIFSFDQVIGCFIFQSFTTNLLFVVFHLYKLFSNGLNTSHTVARGACPNYPSRPFNGYERSISFLVTVITVLARSLIVALFAAEVQRFIDQINGSMVSLTGLKFFYVTREFVLSVVSTIITYELVLLQFK